MTKQPSLKLGFLPLLDATPLVIAKEKGFFAEQGLDVELCRVNSWAQMRDQLAFCEIDVAHMLAPMVPASWLKGAYSPKQFVTALSLNLNGNAITVSNSLFDELMDADADAMMERPVTARAMRKLIANRIKRGEAPPVIGSVFPYSSHNYAVRYWLGAEGIHPDRDVRMVVAPPPLMVDQLEAGQIDAFCVGEPWNTLAEHRGSGRAIVATKEIWRHFPEKVLGVRADWAQQNPQTHLALVTAVLGAMQWLDQPRHRREAVYLMSLPEYIGLSPTLLAAALLGAPALRDRKSVVQGDDFLIFHHYAANFPWQSHALWFLTQMVRWGQISEAENIQQIAENGYLPDLYRQAAAVVGVAAPLIDKKIEGGRDRAWVLNDATAPIAMPRGDFVDGGLFNPSEPARYIESFLRHTMRISPSEIG